MRFWVFCSKMTSMHCTVLYHEYRGFCLAICHPEHMSLRSAASYFNKLTAHSSLSATLTFYRLPAHSPGTFFHQRYLICHSWHRQFSTLRPGPPNQLEIGACAARSESNWTARWPNYRNAALIKWWHHTNFNRDHNCRDGRLVSDMLSVWLELVLSKFRIRWSMIDEMEEKSAAGLGESDAAFVGGLLIRSWRSEFSVYLDCWTSNTDIVILQLGSRLKKQLLLQPLIWVHRGQISCTEINLNIAASSWRPTRPLFWRITVILAPAFTRHDSPATAADLVGNSIFAFNHRSGVSETAQRRKAQFLSLYFSPSALLCFFHLATRARLQSSLK